MGLENKESPIKNFIPYNSNESRILLFEQEIRPVFNKISLRTYKQCLDKLIGIMGKYGYDMILRERIGTQLYKRACRESKHVQMYAQLVVDLKADEIEKCANDPNAKRIQTLIDMQGKRVNHGIDARCSARETVMSELKEMLWRYRDYIDQNQGANDTEDSPQTLMYINSMRLLGHLFIKDDLPLDFYNDVVQSNFVDLIFLFSMGSREINNSSFTAIEMF